jgi:hypothetical protein
MAVSELHTSGSDARLTPPVFRLVLLALFAALGVVLRRVELPTSLPDVKLTPGFTIPLLTGMALGPIEALACGLIVGISGALSEMPLIPILGNPALGLSTGILSLARRRLPYPLWAGLCVMSGSFFGGFLPTFAVLFFFQPVVALASGLTDALQAVVWTIVALLLDKMAIQPMLARLVGSAGAAGSGEVQAKPSTTSSDQR